MKTITYVPRKRLEGIINNGLSLVGLCMFVFFYFQQFPWHTCNIFLSEEKLNKESDAQGFPVRRETPESLSL